jgi:hypothetical protein
MVRKTRTGSGTREGTTTKTSTALGIIMRIGLTVVGQPTVRLMGMQQLAIRYLKKKAKTSITLLKEA